MSAPQKASLTPKENNQCDACKKRFNTNAMLQLHMVKHIPSKDTVTMSSSDENVPAETRCAPKEIENQQSNPDTTLCKICKLRCSSRKKLDTHMKSHTIEDTYDMTLLQDAIKPASSLDPSFNYTNCKEEFQQKHELRKHIKLNHPNFKPCKNFISSQRCDFGSKCDYQHVVIAEGTFVCWDCGKMFNDKKELMDPRKKAHGTKTICRKFLEGGCDRIEEACWYSHTTNYAIPIETNEADFPQLPQNKTKPKKQPTGTESPTINQSKGDQTQKILKEVMILIQNQNTAIMKMMAQMMSQEQYLH